MEPDCRTGGAGDWRAEDAPLQAAFEHATHLLPSQGPISVFVHHNTLHAFEELPFEEAVLEGGRCYDCEPWLSEDRYRREFQRGRIRIGDIQAVLAEDLGDEADILVASFGTRFALRQAMMQFPFRQYPDAELQWLILETDAQQRFRPEMDPALRDHMIEETRHWVLRDLRGNGSGTEQRARQILDGLLAERGGARVESWSQRTWESFVLQFLWRVCNDGLVAAMEAESALKPAGAAGADSRSAGSEGPQKPIAWQRHRDLLLAATGRDADAPVNELLIRFCAAFLDQGFAGWELPKREEGFFAAFTDLYSCPATVVPAWMRGLRRELLALRKSGITPVESIRQSVAAFGIRGEELDGFVLQSLLALRGWAGLIWQMETNAPWAPCPAPRGTLQEYLAIRLILDRHSLCALGPAELGESEPGGIREAARRRIGVPPARSMAQQAFAVFQTAQVRGWSPEDLVHLSGLQWLQLVREINLFPSLERRRIFHLCYERRYRNDALDALIHHAEAAGKGRGAVASPPAWQIVCCIDDREESFRRHLEECDPQCETFSAAGFFAVAMYYQGAAEAHHRPLCPIIITPRHYVREEPVFSATDVSEKRSQRRRLVGRMTHQVHARSRTLLGGVLTGILGSLATFPLVARILAPRLTARIRSRFGSLVQPPATELHVERVAETPGPAFEGLGFSVTEMAAIVTRILQDLGLVGNFAPIVVFAGHGSSSMNNPHESAYNCGACSGGRGGPNARAFALMANDPRVRSLVARAGIEIPDEVRFVGAYHNTCNDHMEYFDLDQLPRPLRPLFRRIEKSIDAARARNAHERSRRFESAPPGMTFQEALQHVEERAEDLSQARPEYNHATNALCLVGRRSWSRGLFLDRRAFLNSYDPSIDDDNASILARILAAAVPVCGGISLEYWFSTVDNEGYGCGSKLPHNIASLAGVMTGAASDIRTGLSAQMVEIHEPMRILFVIETTPGKMDRIIEANPVIRQLVRQEWVQIALFDPEKARICRLVRGRWVDHSPGSGPLPVVPASLDWYRGWRDDLGFCAVLPAPDAPGPSGFTAQESR